MKVMINWSGAEPDWERVEAWSYDDAHNLTSRELAKVFQFIEMSGERCCFEARMSSENADVWQVRRVQPAAVAVGA